jgi:hypothetical protein
VANIKNLVFQGFDTMTEEYSPKPETIYVRVKKSMNSEFMLGVICIIVITGSLTIIQVMMIVNGIMYPDIVCKSPCKVYSCNTTRINNYILPSPPIGISPRVWLICGGCFGIMFIICLIRTSNQHSTMFNTWSKTIMMIAYLLSFAWLIVGAIVYDQTVNQCTNYNKVWFIESKAFDWLKGTMIGGFCVILLPLALQIISIILCCNGLGCELQKERNTVEYKV